MSLKRNRTLYFVLILLTIALGLISRKGFTPEMIDPYLGDYLYAILFFFIVGFLFPKKETWKVALLSILICYGIELSQLCQMEWIQTIRSYQLGGLILGYGFLWSDIVCYTVGGLTGYLLESAYYHQQ